MPSGNGVNDALDAKVYETLVRDFGEAKAKAILGGEPARRRQQVPDVVGKRAKPSPALVRNPNGPKGVSWRERDDRVEKPRVRLVRYRRQSVTCAGDGCGKTIIGGEEHMLVTWAGPQGRQARYCPPCGTKAAARRKETPHP